MSSYSANIKLTSISRHKSVRMISTAKHRLVTPRHGQNARLYELVGAAHIGQRVIPGGTFAVRRLQGKNCAKVHSGKGGAPECALGSISIVAYQSMAEIKDDRRGSGSSTR